MQLLILSTHRVLHVSVCTHVLAELAAHRADLLIQRGRVHHHLYTRHPSAHDLHSSARGTGPHLLLVRSHSENSLHAHRTYIEIMRHFYSAFTHANTTVSQRDTLPAHPCAWKARPACDRTRPSRSASPVHTQTYTQEGCVNILGKRPEETRDYPTPSRTSTPTHSRTV